MQATETQAPIGHYLAYLAAIEWLGHNTAARKISSTTKNDHGNCVSPVLHYRIPESVAGARFILTIDETGNWVLACRHMPSLIWFSHVPWKSAVHKKGSRCLSLECPSIAMPGATSQKTDHVVPGFVLEVEGAHRALAMLEEDEDQPLKIAMFEAKTIENETRYWLVEPYQTLTLRGAQQ